MVLDSRNSRSDNQLTAYNGHSSNRGDFFSLEQRPWKTSRRACQGIALQSQQTCLVVISEYCDAKPLTAASRRLSMHSNRNEFAEQLRRLRQGDSQAISTFVEEYAPYLRRSLRFRIRGPLSSRLPIRSTSASPSWVASCYVWLREDMSWSQRGFASLLAAIANKKFLMFQRRNLPKSDRVRSHYRSAMFRNLLR